MWWDIIPTGTIIMACIAIPQYAAWYWNQAFFGNHFRRRTETLFEREMFSRDGRLSGAAWIHKGLETVPDE